MKYTTTLVLAIILLAVAVLIYVFRDQLTGEKPARPPERPGETLPLLADVKMDDLASATLEEPAAEGKFKTRLALKKAEGKWRLAEPVDSPADDYEVGRLLRAAVEGKYRQTVEPGKKGQPTLASLGLEPPAYRLLLVTAAKGKEAARTVTVSVGRRSALGEGLYVRVDDQPKAAVLDKADLLERAREKVNTYRSRDIISLAREDVLRVGLEGEKGNVQLDRSDKDKDRWVMAQPMAARVDPDALSALLRAALGPTAKEFVEDDPKDLARYGLDRPRLTVTLWKQGPGQKPEKPKEEGSEPRPSGSGAVKDEKKPEAKTDEKPGEKPEPVKALTLRFGAWADIKNETVYLLTDDGKHVLAVEASYFKDLDKSAADVRDKHVLAIETSKAVKVSVKVPAKLTEKGAEAAYELAKKDGKWKLAAPDRPEAKADSAAVEGLLKELADLKVLYFAEGEHADVAKGYAPQGSVRIQVEGEAAEQGFDVGGPPQTPSLLKNLREDWIGRVNEKGFAYLNKAWLDYVDKQVFSLDPKKVASVTVRTADRKVVLERKDDKWKMTAPVEADPASTFAPDLLDQIKDLRCEKFVAAAADLKPYNLQEPELVCTVALAPEKDGEKPAEKVLALSHYEKSRIAGRADAGDLVFEVPAAVFAALAGEPLEKTVTDLYSGDVKDVDVSGEKGKVRLLRIDSKWFRADRHGAPGDEVSADAAKDVAQAAASLSAVRWAAYDAKDAAGFGLERPALTVKVATDKASATLLISGKEVPPEVAALVDQKPVRYAMTEGGKRIAVIAGKNVETLLAAQAAFEPKKEEEPKKDEAKKDDAAKEEPKPEADKAK
ncbi:MAG: DUF4340 domain-containing protein [Planctomycetes bacterium]|nr:DUF4340 domain-containing protein [Planctomycetota bacterium]